MARVSIITPSFNRADIVGETASSIFAQTHSDWEWIIVDDGSSDGSEALFKSYAEKDARISFYKRESDPKGASHCRNIAVEKATGKELIFLDTDDLLAPFCLEQRTKLMEANNDLDFGIFPMLLFDRQPYDVGLFWNIDKDADDAERILRHDAICQGTGTLWRTDSFRKIGMWNTGLRIWQDVELHLRSFISGLKYEKFMTLKPDVFIRRSQDSLSRGAYHSTVKIQSRMSVFFSITELMSPEQRIKYRNGLRVMANDVIQSAVRSGNNSIAREVIDRLESYKLASNQELRMYKNYVRLNSIKLTKLKPVESYFQKFIRSSLPTDSSTLGKVRYNGDGSNN